MFTSKGSLTSASSQNYGGPHDHMNDGQDGGYGEYSAYDLFNVFT